MDRTAFGPRKNLTINVGLRFELNSLYNGIRGQKSAFNFSNGKLIIPSSIDPAVQPLTATLLQLFGDRLQYTKDLGLPDSIQGWQPNLRPRIGFAWRPGHSNNWVVRYRLRHLLFVPGQQHHQQHGGYCSFRGLHHYI